MKIVVGIDGGGTKTRLKTVNERGEALADVIGVASNLNRVSEEDVAQTLRGLTAQCGVDPSKVDAVCMGAAGASSPVLASNLRAVLSECFPLARVAVVSDMVAAYYGGIHQGDEVVVIAGTGSVAVGKDPNGKLIRVGGWGYLLGDEGSGYDIGLQTLKAVLRAYDGRGRKTVLTELLCREFSLSSPTELVTLIYEQKVSPSIFAPLCATACEQGDEVGRSIVARAADELFVLYEAVANEMRAPKQPNCVLTGGVGEKMSSLRIAVADRVQKKGGTVLFSAHSAVDGCVLAALRSLEENSQNI